MLKLTTAALILVATVASASAGMTCTTYGNTTTCSYQGQRTTCTTYGNTTTCR